MDVNVKCANCNRFLCKVTIETEIVGAVSIKCRNCKEITVLTGLVTATAKVDNVNNT